MFQERIETADVQTLLNELSYKSQAAVGRLKTREVEIKEVEEAASHSWSAMFARPRFTTGILVSIFSDLSKLVIHLSDMSFGQRTRQPSQ